jgi:hypothetical protein
MKFTKVAAIAVMLGAFGAGALHAQSFRNQPAEFPPSSYKGKQYVDSKGCVFIRAGIDGNVTWVPRVSRKREGVCGFKPSNVGSASAAPAASASAPVQITLDGAPAQVQPRPAPVRTAAAPRPAPQARPAPVVVRQQPVRQLAAPRVVTAPAAPVIARAPVAAAPASGSCPGRSALSQQYSGSRSAGLAVRCGPQSAPIVASGPRAGNAGQFHGAAPVAVTPTTRIVPKHVARDRINTYANVAVPKGYKPVWEDDRLNPKRAEQNLSGRSQMLLIWTNTVPRRLINQSNGKDMTASLPLVYPYTSIQQQRREFGEVTLANRNGQLVKRIVRNGGAAPVGRKPVYSSRSAPKAAVAAPSRVQAAGSSYVQVGTFANSANAQKTAQRIAAMGMGARIGKSTRGGKTYLSVQAGPFGAAAAPGALGKLRGAGYRDAFIR